MSVSFPAWKPKKVAVQLALMLPLHRSSLPYEMRHGCRTFQKCIQYIRKTNAGGSCLCYRILWAFLQDTEANRIQKDTSSKMKLRPEDVARQLRHDQEELPYSLQDHSRPCRCSKSLADFVCKLLSDTFDTKDFIQAPCEPCVQAK